MTWQRFSVGVTGWTTEAATANEAAGCRQAIVMVDGHVVWWRSDRSIDRMSVGF